MINLDNCWVWTVNINTINQLFSDIMTYIETPEPYYEPSEEGPKLKFKRRKKSKRKKL